MLKTKILNIVFFDYSSTPILTGTKIYRQIAENISSACQPLFREVSITSNQMRLEADYYILLCAHLTTVENLKRFPATRTVYYNFEQMYSRLTSRENIKNTSLEYIVDNFVVADYSSHNITAWASVEPHYPAQLVQYGYNRLFAEYTSNKKNIDILYYGGIDTEIAEYTKKLSVTKGLFPKICLLRNIYDDELYDYINRSRLVLSHISGIFPSVRISPLVSSGIPVVCCGRLNEKVDKPFDSLVTIVDIDKFSDITESLLQDDSELIRYGEQCREKLFKLPFVSNLENLFYSVDRFMAAKSLDTTYQ